MQEPNQNQATQEPTEKLSDKSYRWWEIEGKLEKIEQAFAIGCTDSEACNYAEITVDQLYYYTREINPEFQARKEALKEKPILRAKYTIVEALGNPEHAKWYLERKRKKEFGNAIDLTSDGDKLNTIEVTIVKNETQPKGDGGVREELPSQNPPSGEPGGDEKQQDVLPGADVRSEGVRGEERSLHDLP